MKALVIDNSINQLIISYGNKHDYVYSIYNNRNAEDIHNILSEFFSNYNVNFDDISVIGYSKGPGSFVGVRIAASIAQGLVFAKNKLAVSVSSLETLANIANNIGIKDILVAIDARQKELYVTRIQYKDKKKIIINETLFNIDTMKEYINNNINISYIGNGFNEYNIKSDFITYNNDQYVQSLLELTNIEYDKRNFIDIENMEPNYIRNNVAKAK